MCCVLKCKNIMTILRSSLLTITLIEMIFCKLSLTVCLSLKFSLSKTLDSDLIAIKKTKTTIGLQGSNCQCILLQHPTFRTDYKFCISGCEFIFIWRTYRSHFLKSWRVLYLEPVFYLQIFHACSNLHCGCKATYH